jgi:hypothetical protein
VSRLSGKCESLDYFQPYEPARPVTVIALLFRNFKKQYENVAWIYLAKNRAVTDFFHYFGYRDYIVSDGGMTDELKGSGGVGCQVDLLSRHLPGETEENYEEC